jgi:hypothetical protein
MRILITIFAFVLNFNLTTQANAMCYGNSQYPAYCWKVGNDIPPVVRSRPQLQVQTGPRKRVVVKTVYKEVEIPLYKLANTQKNSKK